MLRFVCILAVLLGGVNSALTAPGPPELRVPSTTPATEGGVLTYGCPLTLDQTVEIIERALRWRVAQVHNPDAWVHAEKHVTILLRARRCMTQEVPRTRLIEATTSRPQHLSHEYPLQFELYDMTVHSMHPATLVLFK